MGRPHGPRFFGCDMINLPQISGVYFMSQYSLNNFIVCDVITLPHISGVFFTWQPVAMSASTTWFSHVANCDL